MSLLRAQDLAHGYTRGGLLSRKQRVQVLRDLDLDLREGESVGLLGASGSGKSTLARLLMGVERPEQGRILFRDGRAEAGGQAFLRAVQMVFQDAPSAFNPRFSVGWSIAEPLRHLRGLDVQACAQRVAGLLEQVQLDPADADKLPLQLSGGQLQRAGIARALAAEPRLIILDEALSNLDRTLQLHMLELLTELRERLGTAFLLITHDLSLVRYFCQRVLLLADGSIVEDRAVTPGMRFAHPAGQLLEAAVLPGEPADIKRHRTASYA
ncbi:ATP-binding cassette domain-containing protein [Pseudomonas sp. JDS28PS106]|uniref:ATP-binding cassette domain-containing protein n=1 Tax=Pseudomonas sp. JDS28PS106 TaxID=2497235 RepID=UPI002FD73A24